MAKEDDVSDADSAAAGESRSSRTARARGIDGDAPPSADAIGAAVAKALERQRNAPPEPARVLPAVVRASVRAGYEDKVHHRSDGSRQIVNSPRELTFEAHETDDGVKRSVPHGRPVRLKREAFERYYADGLVEIAQ